MLKRAMMSVGLPAALLLSLAALPFFACAEYDGKLSVTITQQPTGGYGVNTVSCTFEGTSIHNWGGSADFPEPIILRSSWHSTHGVYNEETMQWDHGAQTLTKTTSKSAPAGAHLDKPFWCELTWTDTNGKHWLVSDTAYCQ